MISAKNACPGLFFRKQKGTRIFQWRAILKDVLVISALSSTKSQFFEILIFSQDILGNIHYVSEMNLIS